ncbi:hypothetical protein [Corynebacterium bovis]|uniref:Uncharacterized protein n=2 Tax=Corynebacterium bovis TaxID=36808 RepID=A0A8H9YAS7_9CORY|nr:hypothetical protein [Corynebacterium bovis]MBB3115239.1 hypothetical protein [Corynebacterium bovis DSM 20582 = CIP 54.80]MDK8509887.1 hypothetical protein [Corynebacterium bovis]QQC47816.1 hypothetical protein I6I09_02400 [Corynebacterium bovis]RRO80214.1 hypothetical protein CXF38_07255 [Corynebacterium bovis]RRO82168.1 hypothetical protein CXF36_06005 [Corynebacterium bovis]
MTDTPETPDTPDPDRTPRPPSTSASSPSAPAPDPRTAAEVTDAACDTFRDNLEAMATGSYLRPDDLELWEPPYPPSVVADADAAVRDLVSAGRTAVEQGTGTITLDLCDAVATAVARLRGISDAHGGAVLEEEEIADVTAVLAALSDETGADGEVVLTHAETLLDEE